MKKLILGVALLMCVGIALCMTGSEDAYATDSGTAQIPLAEIDTNAYDLIGYTWYVLPNSEVTIVPYSSGGTTAIATSVTEGYGLTLTDGTVSGTIIGGGGYVTVAVDVTSGGSTTHHNATIIPNPLTTYTITYDANGGTGTMANSQIVSNTSGWGQPMLKECEFTKSGFAFAGWDVNGTTYLPGQTVSVYENTSKTATAIWVADTETPNTHTIQYQAGGPYDGSVADTVVTDHLSRSYVTLAPNGFTRSGYTFVGWKFTTGPSTVYLPGTAVPINAGSTMIAVAQWQIDPVATYTHTVTYLANGGTGTMTDDTGTSNANLPLAITLSSCDFTRTGYIFTGWRIIGGIYIPLNAGGYSEVNGDVYQSGDTILTYSTPVKAIAQWESTNPLYTHTITYALDGGTGTVEDSVVTDHTSGDSFVYVTYTTPYKEGYIFSGWLINGTIYYGGQAVTVGGNATVTATAQWSTAYTHTITYSANGGTGTMADTVVRDTVSGNSNVTLAPNGFTNTGYTFAGWSVNDIIYQPNTQIPVAGNSTVTATAQWEEGSTHTISYVANGGSGAMSDTVITDSNTGDTDVTLAPNGFTYVGHRFVGWQVNGIIQQPGSTVAVAGGSTVTATAQWEVAYTHTIRYISNGGTGTMEDTVVTDNISGNTDVTLAPNGFVYTGRTFTGWKIGETIYQPGDTVPVAGNVTANATAQWTVTYTHTISYLANGGTGTMTDTVVSDNVSGPTNVTLANCTYTRTGYTFTGWLVGGTVRQVGDEIPVNGNAVISATAQWIENSLTASANNIIGYSERVYSNQMYATASTGGVISYAVASVTGGTATVDTSGLVTYTAPQVNASQVYTVTVTVTATFPSTETVVRNVSFTASIDPTPTGVTINTGIAQTDVDQTPEGYYVDDVNFNNMGVTVFIGPQYTETETNNIMDDVPQVRSLVGIIPILMIAGIVAYVAHSMKTSRR